MLKAGRSVTPPRSRWQLRALHPNPRIIPLIPTPASSLCRCLIAPAIDRLSLAAVALLLVLQAYRAVILPVRAACTLRAPVTAALVPPGMRRPVHNDQLNLIARISAIG